LENCGFVFNRFQLFVKAFKAVVQVTVNFKDIVQLKQLKQFHNFFADAANFEMAKVNAGSFHDGKKYSKSRTVNKTNTFEIEDQFGIGFVKKVIELLFYRFRD
jgi:hypothetical protein